MGNTQIVVPFLTQQYGGGQRDPPEKSIAICTLKNFPHKIEHTLQWARDWFEGVFKQSPGDVNGYVSDKEYVDKLRVQQNTRLESLSHVHDALVVNRPHTFADCVHWARLRFSELFHDNILQLLHNFPPDLVTSTGQAFWSGHKREPAPCVFDAEDDTHMQFVMAAANVRATNFGLEGSVDPAVIKAALADYHVPDFVPRSGVKIHTEEKEAEEAAEAPLDTDSEFDELLSKLPLPSSLSGFRVTPVDFEKDDDEHMAVVTAVANLRARNYRIEETDMHNARRIAGRIIPAIATTTALVVGLSCIELLKVQQKKPFEAYRNAYLNIAVPTLQLSEPEPCPSHDLKRADGTVWKWTLWDVIDLASPLTLQQLLDHFKEAFGLDVTMLSFNVSILYSFFTPPAKIAQRKPMLMEDLAKLICKTLEIPASQKYMVFEPCCEDDDGEDIDTPSIRYKLRD
jgi:ubiquitin-activating enzyme E1